MAETTENLPILPEDLINEILLRIPNLKSIARCKCVSKTWQSFLSSPHGPENIIFVGHYADHPPVVTIFNSKSCVATKVKLPFCETKSFTPLAPFWPVQGSCHGLVLLCFRRSLLLLNPVTREAVEIPHSKRGDYNGCGLGYDRCNDDFKVVSIGKNDIDIYSVKTRTWRTLPNSSPFSYHARANLTRVFVNGCLTFMSPTGHVIAAFNVATEKFESVPYPKGVYYLKSFDKLTVVGGCLALVVVSSRTSFDLWLMKEYGVQDSWTKYTVHAPSYCMKPLCFSGEDEIVLMREYPTKFVGYNLRNGVCRDMVVDGAPVFIWSGTGMSFTESRLQVGNLKMH